MIPAALAPYRRYGERDTVFWFVTLVALAGPLIRSFASHYGAWRTGFSAALWVTVAATMVVYVLLAAAKAVLGFGLLSGMSTQYFT